MTKGEAETERKGWREAWLRAGPVYQLSGFLCVCVCALCPVPMQASGLHKGTEGAYTQMGKQSHCLLLCFLLCWERLVVIDFSQPGPGRVEARGKRSHHSPYLHTHSEAHSHRVSPLRRTPLPLRLSRPCQFLSQCVYLKYADEAFVVPCPSLDAHSFGLRSIMA